MFDLRPKPGYDEIRALTILAGDKPCIICGRALPGKYTRLQCNTCRWHYQRKAYHAVYCYMLRAYHSEANTSWWRNYGQFGNKPCMYCMHFYEKHNSLEYAMGGHDEIPV